MTGYEPCELHEVSNCSTCSGLDKQLTAEESFERLGPFTPAQISGKCPKCGESFDVGTLVYVTDGGWICCP